MASTGAGWAQLRQQARQLESQTETLFQQYSQYASMTNLPAAASQDEKSIEMQLKDILDRREATLTSLSRVLENPSPSPNSQQNQQSALKSSHLSRHQQILSQHRQDLSRLRSQIHDVRNRSNLLSTVHRDISSYRSTQQDGDPGHNAGAAEGEYMLQERSRLDSSHGMADNLLSQAFAVNEQFGVQREQLERVRRRAAQIAGMVPGVNGLIGRIGGKRRRDGIILGGFIAVCFLFFFFIS